MTLTSFDLVSDSDGSILKTTNDISFESAVVNAIHHLGYILLTNTNESDLIECRLVSQETNEVEHEFVSYSIEAANIDALSIIGYTVYESLTEAELNSINNTNDEDFEDSLDEMIDDLEDIEDGKIVAFSFEL